MIPTVLTPPEHYSADVAYKALAPLRPFIDTALPLLTTGLTARVARDLFGQLERISLKLYEAHESGSLDGSPTWKATVAQALQDIGAIVTVAGPIQIKYAEMTGSVITAGAQSGQAVSLDEANETILFEQADIDAIVAAISSVIET